MLRKFSVENYKNFQKKITLDFTNKRDYSFRTECTKNGLISKAIIMGHNASGKTNLAYALFDIVYTLTDNMFVSMQKDVGSFINGNSNKNVATFSYEFQNGTDIINYEYHKYEPELISYESLTINDEVIFKFNYKTGKFNTNKLAEINADSLNLDALDGTISALRVIMNNTLQPKDSHISFLKDFVNRMLYFKYVNKGPDFIGFHKTSSSIESFILSNNLLDDFQKFLNECGLDIQLDEFKTPMGSQIVQKFSKKVLFFSPLMSSGTAVLELYYFWSKYFDKVSFLYIDEFDASYHFELAKKILQKTIENVQAQAVFTTHNTYLLNTDIMRPDCYLTINEGNLVSFADSTERELREVHNLEKMYRNKEFE